MPMTYGQATKAAQRRADRDTARILVLYDVDLADEYGKERAYWIIDEDSYDPDEQHEGTTVMTWIDPASDEAEPVIVPDPEELLEQMRLDFLDAQAEARNPDNFGPRTTQADSDERDYTPDEFEAEAEAARWDDDPSPYDGSYSED